MKSLFRFVSVNRIESERLPLPHCSDIDTLQFLSSFDLFTFNSKIFEHYSIKDLVVSIIFVNVWENCRETKTL